MRQILAIVPQDIPYPKHQVRGYLQLLQFQLTRIRLLRPMLPVVLAAIGGGISFHPIWNIDRSRNCRLLSVLRVFMFCCIQLCLYQIPLL